MVDLGKEDELQTGVRLIETSRQCLAFMTGELFHPQMICANRTASCRRIHDTLRYLRRNLEREETLMRLCGYPDHIQHKAEHDDFLKKLTELYETLKCSTYDNEEFRHLIIDWTASHAEEHDKQFGDFLKNLPST